MARIIQDLPARQSRRYSFGYVIKNQETFTDFERQEKSDGTVTSGSYRVNLPDGRVQIVTYRSSPETGNVMTVSYEGEAKYPEYVPIKKMIDYPPQPKTDYANPAQYSKSSKPVPYSVAVQLSEPIQYSSLVADPPPAPVTFPAPVELPVENPVDYSAPIEWPSTDEYSTTTPVATAAPVQYDEPIQSPAPAPVALSVPFQYSSPVVSFGAADALPKPSDRYPVPAVYRGSVRYSRVVKY